MKNLILFAALLFLATTFYAQSPQFINYQAVVRNNTGEVVKNQNVRFRLSITEGLNGTTAYSETHQATTNNLGLVNLSIGSGTFLSGSFTNVNWSTGTKFLKVEVDPTGGTLYTLTGNQQFASVPYALHAATANSILNQWQTNTNGIHYNSGRIGIGTNTPGYKLTLQDNVTGVYEGSADPRSFINIRNTSAGQYATANTQLFCGSTTFTKLEHVSPNFFISDFADQGQVWASGKGLILRASPATANDPTPTAIKFMTGYRADGGSNERMRITVNGNVGIGTAAPTTKLEVKDGDVYVNDPTKGIILKSPNGSCWRVTIDNTGNFVRTAITCPN
jgi:hypothetical protein